MLNHRFPISVKSKQLAYYSATSQYVELRDASGSTILSVLRVMPNATIPERRAGANEAKSEAWQAAWQAAPGKLRLGYERIFSPDTCDLKSLEWTAGSISCFMTVSGANFFSDDMAPNNPLLVLRVAIIYYNTRLYPASHVRSNKKKEIYTCASG